MTDDKQLTINDLSKKEQEAYSNVTDMLSVFYDDSISWRKIGQLLVNSSDD